MGPARSTTRSTPLVQGGEFFADRDALEKLAKLWKVPSEKAAVDLGELLEFAAATKRGRPNPRGRIVYRVKWQGREYTLHLEPHGTAGQKLAMVHWRQRFDERPKAEEYRQRARNGL